MMCVHTHAYSYSLISVCMHTISYHNMYMEVYVCKCLYINICLVPVWYIYSKWFILWPSDHPQPSLCQLSRWRIAPNELFERHSHLCEVRKRWFGDGTGQFVENCVSWHLVLLPPQCALSWCPPRVSEHAYRHCPKCPNWSQIACTNGSIFHVEWWCGILSLDDHGPWQAMNSGNQVSMCRPSSRLPGNTLELTTCFMTGTTTAVCWRQGMRQISRGCMSFAPEPMTYFEHYMMLASLKILWFRETAFLVRDSVSIWYSSMFQWIFAVFFWFLATLFAQVVYDPDQVKKERERGGGQVSWRQKTMNIH